MNMIISLSNIIISAFLTASISTPAMDIIPKEPEKILTIAFTTDVHGNFFPFDYIKLKEGGGSYARIASAVDSIRRREGEEKVVLLDNGDILQGQPTVYYYNYIDTLSSHITSEIYDYMKVDAATIGNHDIETGHAVYDRWRKQTKTPVIAANVIDINSGEPYFEPYALIRRGGLKIAVLGLLTPAIPAWLPENLWSGLRFEPMEESALKWIDIICEKESPDLVIGLFHSGKDSDKTTAGYIENASLDVARNVDGLDAVLFGHDHIAFCDTVKNKSGKYIPVLNTANNAMNLGILDVFADGNGYKITPRLISVRDIEPSKQFMDMFSDHSKEVAGFVNRKIAVITDSIMTRDAFFGPSSFMTLLHELQLEISDAEVSMAAPLTFDGCIAAGSLRVADMFTLYKYENMLSTLSLSGQEIKDYLEYSYDQWIQTVNDTNPHLVKFADDKPSPKNNRLKNPSYNFDSAAGIEYTVDITRPFGQRVNITAMSSGEPFEPEKRYRVAVNSYRAGGGGNHLTEGAGISPEELKHRVISTTEKDLRYYLIRLMERRQVVKPSTEKNWRFIPENIVEEAVGIDRHILFGTDSSLNQK